MEWISGVCQVCLIQTDDDEIESVDGNVGVMLGYQLVAGDDWE